MIDASYYERLLRQATQGTDPHPVRPVDERPEEREPSAHVREVEPEGYPGRRTGPVAPPYRDEPR